MKRVQSGRIEFWDSGTFPRTPVPKGGHLTFLWFHPKDRRPANRDKDEANKEENYTEAHH